MEQSHWVCYELPDHSYYYGEVGYLDESGVVHSKDNQEAANNPGNKLVKHGFGIYIYPGASENQPVTKYEVHICLFREIGIGTRKMDKENWQFLVNLSTKEGSEMEPIMSTERWYGKTEIHTMVAGRKIGWKEVEYSSIGMGLPWKDHIKQIILSTKVCWEILRWAKNSIPSLKNRLKKFISRRKETKRSRVDLFWNWKLSKQIKSLNQLPKATKIIEYLS